MLVLTHFPRFLALLEEEIFSANSPIWDPDFKQMPPNHHLQAILDNKTSELTTKFLCVLFVNSDGGGHGGWVMVVQFIFPKHFIPRAFNSCEIYKIFTLFFITSERHELREV